jgi:hypothetical protein
MGFLKKNNAEEEKGKVDLYLWFYWIILITQVKQGRHSIK